MAEKRKVGRPSLYSEALVETICNRIAAGESMRSVCRSEGMPDRQTVLNWLDTHEEFSAKYARARLHQADSVDDDIVDMLDEVKTGTLDPQAARVLLAGYQWRASKLSPKKYGDRVDLTHSAPDGGPVRLMNVMFGAEPDAER
jgi:hypothetical protein